MRVIVTGAAQGIGECVARMLAQDGHNLVLADIQEKKVAAVAAKYLKSLARRERFDALTSFAKSNPRPPGF